MRAHPDYRQKKKPEGNLYSSYKYTKGEGEEFFLI